MRAAARPRVAAATPVACATLAATLVLATTACSGLPSASRSPATGIAPAMPRHEAPAVVRRIAQTDFGREATFKLCAQPACPRHTPKTLGASAAAHDPLPPPTTRPAPLPAAPLPAVPVAPSVPAPAPAAVPALSPAHGAPGVPDGASPVGSPPIVVSPTVASPATSRDVPPPPPVGAATARLAVTVTFAFGTSQLTPSGRSALSSALPQARRAERIVIAGRTDSVGDPEVNRALAFARALAVRDYLRDRAPDLPGTIVIDARGNCCYVAANDSAAGRAANRRVEVLLSLGREA